MADIPFINRAQVDQTTGEIVATTVTPDDTFAFLGAFAFDPDMAMAVTTDSPPAATDTLNEGISVTPAGQVHIWDFDSDGTPASGIFYVGGIPVSGLGEVIITADAVVGWVGGWPIAANSFVVMDTGGTPPPPGCDNPTTILTQAFNNTDGAYTSQFDTSGGGFGDYAKTYEDFTFADGAIVTDFHWTGGYSTVGSEGLATSWLVEFWDDVGGQPGATPIQSQVFTPVEVNETFIGLIGTKNYYHYSVDIFPWFLADGGLTYWISVQASLNAPKSWGWAVCTGGAAWQVFFGEGGATDTGVALDLTGCVGSTPSADLYEVESADGQYLTENGTDFYKQES